MIDFAILVFKLLALCDGIPLSPSASRLTTNICSINSLKNDAQELPSVNRDFHTQIEKSIFRFWFMKIRFLTIPQFSIRFMKRLSFCALVPLISGTVVRNRSAKGHNFLGSRQ